MQLEVRHLEFDYKERELTSGTKPLLNDVCFTVSGGTLLHLRGENGSGKTTLLKLISGLLFPQAGSIHFLETDIWRDLAFYQSHICYVGHKTGISHALTVFENACYDLKNCDVSEMPIWMDKLGLSAIQHVPCGLLSAGQRRRVGLLRLWMSKTPLWILDEPLVALDIDCVDMLMQCMAQHLEQGGLIVLTSHQALPGQLTGYQDYQLC